MNDLEKQKKEIEERLISPSDSQIINSELKQNGNLILEKDDTEIYIFEPGKCPKTLLEIGRQREIMFSLVGGGTNKDCDIDDYDNLYSQIVVWDPKEFEIVGGYRFIVGKPIKTGAVSRLYNLNFTPKELGNTIELGRSFVNFFSKKRMRGLDLLWFGLGYLIKKYKNEYFIGKVTLYPKRLGQESIDIIMNFLEKEFPSFDNSLTPKPGFKFKFTSSPKIKNIFNGESFKDNFNKLRIELKNRNKTIEPLLNSYLKLSLYTQFKGGVKNVFFGNVLEVLLLVPVQKVNEEVIQKYTEPYM